MSVSDKKYRDAEQICELRQLLSVAQFTLSRALFLSLIDNDLKDNILNIKNIVDFLLVRIDDMPF